MPAKNRDDLLAVTHAEFAKLSKILDSVSDELADHRDPTDGLSIKQIIGHRVHWIDLFFGWYDAGKRGGPVHVPAEGYKWNQLKAYNAAVYEAAAKRSWGDIRADLSDRHTKLTVFMEAHDNAYLYTPGLYAWMNTWTLGRWAEASGPAHYRSAAKFVRKVIRAAAAKV